MTIDIYHILRRFSRLGGSRMKLAALWLMHVLHRRYLGVFVDPVLVCNYRCQMCYFSDEDERKRRRGRMTKEQIGKVSKALFGRTLKLQIGCGAEPTMDMEGTMELVRQGKSFGVPYIAMTSNGVRLSYEEFVELIAAGLTELTISLHGVHKETYERLMGPTANYEAFLVLLETIKRVKAEHPKFQVRVNYTMNAENVDELADFDRLFAEVPIDQLQLRPVREIGKSAWRNFDLTHVTECLETVVRPLAERCRKKGITVLFPEKEHIARFEGVEEDDPREKLIALFTYMNVTPMSYPTHDVHFEKESYETYARREQIGRTMFRCVFASRRRCAEIETFLNHSLNYDIR